MIVPMSKVYIVTQSHNHARLLDILAQLGVVHIEPVEPAKAVAEEKTLHTLSTLDNAIRILQRFEPSDDIPEMSSLDAAKEAISLNKAVIDEKDRLSILHRTADQLAVWGNVELKQLEKLRTMGIEIKFFSVTKKDLPNLEAECIEIVAEQSGQEVLIAVIDREGKFQIPEGAKEIPWPNTDLPSVKKEAAQVDASLKQNNQRLSSISIMI